MKSAQFIPAFGRLLLALALGVAPAFLAAQQPAPPKKMDSVVRGESLQMLKDTAVTVRKEYYDPSLHGVDLDGLYRQAEAKIRADDTFSEACGHIAWMLEALNDSHTFFVPPWEPFEIKDGWEMAFVGDKAMITAVKPGSDAEAKGLKPGDQVLKIEGVVPTRDNWWGLAYIFHRLAPRTGYNLEVASPGGETRHFKAMSSVRMLQKNYDVTHNGVDFQKLVDQSHEHDELFKPQEAEVGDVMVLKLPRFLLTDSAIDGYIHKAGKHSALVLDLRDNPGGSAENLERLLGAVLDHDVKVGDRIERSGPKPFTIKSRGSHAYSGKLVVLINSKSESASEIFARVMQLEKRATVVGDRSAGRVMEAKRFIQVPGANVGMRYGLLVSIADLKMADGKSLEHLGVTPDELILPTAEELAAGADPQMSRALQLAGESLSSAKAGLLFPKVWE